MSDYWQNYYAIAVNTSKYNPYLTDFRRSFGNRKLSGEGILKTDTPYSKPGKSVIFLSWCQLFAKADDRKDSCKWEYAKPGEVTKPPLFEVLIICHSKTGIPVSKGLFQFAIEYPGPHLQESWYSRSHDCGSWAIVSNVKTGSICCPLITLWFKRGTLKKYSLVNLPKINYFRITTIDAKGYPGRRWIILQAVIIPIK